MTAKPSYEELQLRVKALEQELWDHRKNSQLLEKDLKKEVVRRRMLVEQSRDGIVVLDEAGRVTETNRKFADMLGYTVEETYRLHVWDWDAQWNREELLAMLGEVDLTGDRFETRHRRKDGTWYDVEISTNGAEFEGEKYIFCVCRDITDRKQAEAELKDSEERLSKMIEEAPVAIQGYLADRTVLYWNRASEATYGYTKEEAIGQRLEDLIIPPRMRKALVRTIEKGIQTGKMPPQQELVLMRKDGTSVPVLNSSAVLKRRSGGTEFIAIDLDLTELKRLQADLQQAHKMEAIGTLTGGIAHDFNNILGIILGNCDLALEDILPQEDAHLFLEEIKMASLRAKGIVRQLVTYCRKIDQERNPVRLIPVLQDTVKLLRATMPATIDIRPRLDAHRDTILSEPSLIYQVMMNLCGNALHAMEAEGGMLTIDVDNVDATALPGVASANGFVRIRISDSGPGIEPAIQDRIFDPYFSTKEVGKGSGMGLSVVQGIVKKHGGEILVESRPGRGATFTVLLPLVEAPEAPLAAEAEAPPAGNETILYIDDEPSMVAMKRNVLERLGYTVIASTSPVDAVERFQSDPQCCDLVVTDMTMPLMTGLQVAQSIKALNPKIPVVLCTGYSERINSKVAQDAGIDAVLMKPVSREDLAGTARRLLDQTCG